MRSRWGEGPDAVFRFRGESDAMIVRGLIAVLAALYNGLTVSEVARVDARAELRRILTDPERIAGTSLRPAHGGRADLVRFEDSDGDLTDQNFDDLYHLEIV